MSTTVSSTTSSTGTTNVNRISGMASGLDTESIVKELTASISTKIDKAKQQEQILEWKQDDYRKISTALVDFNEKYFGSSSGSTSIGDSLSNLTATSSNTKYVTAIASDTAKSANVYISDIVSLATSAKLQSSSAISPALSFSMSLDNLSELSGKSMNVTLDGSTKTITFSNSTYSSSEDVATELTSLLDDAFGEGRINVSGVNGNLTFSSDSSIISIGDSGVEGNEALDTLGFTDSDVSSNRLNTSSTLSSYSSLFGSSETFSFSINGKQFSFANTTSISKIISTINSSTANVKMSYSNVTDKFTIISKETGTGSNISLEDTQGTFLSTIMGGSGKFTAGTNAVIKLSTDGNTDEGSLTTITRNSNTFTIDGTTYILNSMASGTEKEDVTVNIQLDADSLVSKITQFVSDYNTLLGSITSKLTEEYDSDYQPLTDAEKEKLSDTEITTLTDKAKTGLLKNDIYLTNIATSLRSSLYTSVKKLDGSGENTDFILSDIGITTSSYTGQGKLTINESQLRKAISENPEGVITLLTQKSSVSYSLYNSSDKAKQRYNESGLIFRLSDIIKSNISSVGKKGSLITLAGNPADSFIGETTYSKRISEAKETISTLTDKLSTQEDYYWSKFTSMEKAINSLNSQSSWLSSQTSN